MSALKIRRYRLRPDEITRADGRRYKSTFYLGAFEAYGSCKFCGSRLQALSTEGERVAPTGVASKYWGHVGYECANCGIAARDDIADRDDWLPLAEFLGP